MKLEKHILSRATLEFESKDRNRYTFRFRVYRTGDVYIAEQQSQRVLYPARYGDTETIYNVYTDYTSADQMIGIWMKIARDSFGLL